MKSEKIPQGYKKTEIGIIPANWEVKRLGDILKYEQPGKYIVKSTNYHDNGFIPVLTPGKTFILGYTDETEGIYRNVPVILFDDFTTASKYVTFPFKVKSSAVKLLSLRDGCYDLRFIFKKMQLIDYLISEGDHKRRWISEYQHIEIFLPPTLSEQQAIARVLSDVDKLIESIDRLIEKKKMIKKGAMQDLLSGRKRLPGFVKKAGNKKTEIGIIPEDWEVKRLGVIIKVIGGYSFLSNKFTKIGTPIIKISNIQDEKVNSKDLVYYPSNYKISNQFIIKKGDILIAMSGATTGKIGKYTLNIYAFLNQRVGKFSILDNNSIINNYLFFILISNFFQNKLSIYLEQGAQPNISSKQIEDIKIPLPPLSEQRAIAQILSDMDAKIDALEKKKAKYGKIKKGMMEQLLTGKIRLKNKIKEVLK